MTRKSLLLAGLTALVVLGAALYFLFFRTTTAANSPVDTASKADAVSALVKTAPLQRLPLSTQLVAFGDVLTGKVVTVSFPRAGQVTLLPLQSGQRVRAGTLLATLSSDPTAQMSFAQATNALRLAQGEVSRSQQLFALQLATQSQVDTARKGLQDAEATLSVQKSLGDNLAVANVTAPFDGVIVALNVAQGDRIVAGAPLLQLGRIDGLRVQLGIEPSQSRKLKVGMPVTLSPLQNRAQTISAKITTLQDLVDPKTQLVNATVELPASAANFLVPGMHAQGIIDIDKLQTWAVPRQAVLADDAGDYVFQIAQNKARRVTVTKVSEHQDMIGIDGKLDGTLPIVVLGNYELEDGMTVRTGAP